MISDNIVSLASGGRLIAPTSVMVTVPPDQAEAGHTLPIYLVSINGTQTIILVMAEESMTKQYCPITQYIL